MLTSVVRILVAVIALPSWSNALDAVFKGNCDNYGTLQRSDDKGATFSNVVSSASWSTWKVTLTETLSDVTSDTVLRVLCQDVGVVGAFVGQIELQGGVYYTAEGSLWSVLNGNSGDLTYKANGVSPWGAAASSLDADAMWIWNDETYNTLTFDFDFGDVIECSPSLVDAEFKGNCDNYGSFQRSDDNGATFTELVSTTTWNRWEETLTEALEGVTRNTVIRVVCEDVGVIGAFIGQVSVEGEVYYTQADGDWDVIQGYSGYLTYKANGDSPWGSAASTLDSDAMWIWNGDETYNTMTFEFKFRAVLPQIDAEFSGNCDNYGILQRSDDNGVTFTDLVGESAWNAWETTLTQAVEDVTPSTVIRVVCRDVGGIGGFIGQITVDDEVYYTEQDGEWSVVGDYAGDLTYQANGVSPWGAAASTVDSDAMWIWNGDETYNTMTFEITFECLQTVLLPQVDDEVSEIETRIKVPQVDSVVSFRADAAMNKPLISRPLSPRTPDRDTYNEPARYYNPAHDIVGGQSSVAATATSNSTMYLMMLTCALLFANIALIAYSKCNVTNKMNKYAKVSVDYDTEAEAQREVLRE